MSATSTSFNSQQAPCGRIVDGESYQDRDEETLLTQEMDYACGCRTIRHEYHDGSVSQKVIRHDGTVLVDELLSAE
jgi:membrane-bound inhibitor of C-type lysozyme